MGLVGLIARADHGGLGTQTWEAWRHLRPDRTLVVELGAGGRGRADPQRYHGHGTTLFTDNPPGRRIIEQFLKGLDVVFTCETTYRPDLVNIAADLGVQVVVQSNPELYHHDDLGGCRIVLPTEWEAHRVPHERVLTVPVATDRFTPKLRRRATVFYHPAGLAMRDRNGTAIVRAAIPYIKATVVLVIRGVEVHGHPAPRQVTPHVTLVELPWSDDPYFDCWPQQADVLVLPRRYGGLCLPMQEAAAQGIPVLTTALPPQNTYPHCWYIPAERPEVVNMKGGPFEVFDASPTLLGEMITELATRGDLVAELSEAAIQWGHELSWAHHLEDYREVLRAGS